MGHNPVASSVKSYAMSEFLDVARPSHTRASTKHSKVTSPFDNLSDPGKPLLARSVTFGRERRGMGSLRRSLDCGDWHRSSPRVSAR
jgi:hypothetical protein